MIEIYSDHTVVEGDTAVYRQAGDARIKNFNRTYDGAGFSIAGRFFKTVLERFFRLISIFFKSFGKRLIESAVSFFTHHVLKVAFFQRCQRFFYDYSWWIVIKVFRRVYGVLVSRSCRSAVRTAGNEDRFQLVQFALAVAGEAEFPYLFRRVLGEARFDLFPEVFPRFGTAPFFIVLCVDL